MVWQELQLEDVVQSLQAMQLDALIVVDVRPFLLSHGEHVFRVQPLNGVHRLHDVNLALQLLFDPIEGGNVTTATTNQKMTAVTRVVDPEN